MARRSDHSRAQLEALILDAAVALVKKSGPQSLTARALATKIGYAPGTIYHVYGGMDPLVLMVNAETLDRLHANLNAVPDTGDIRTGVHALARAYRAFIAANRSLWLMLFDTVLPLDRVEQGWYQTRIDRLFEPLQTRLTKAYPAADRARMDMAARVLWSSFHGLCWLEEKGQAKTVGAATGIDAMTDFLIDNFISGLEKR